MLQKILYPFEETFKETLTEASFLVRVKYVALGTVIFSMAANGFAYLNLYPQYDSLNHVFRTAGNWEVRLGRFLQPLYGKLRGQITMPWLIGILSMFYITIAVFLVCDMLDIQNKCQIFLTAGFFSANVTITQMCAVFVYINDIYLAALMLSTMGVWAIQKIRGLNGMLCGGICFSLSMGLYQAYMVVAVILFMLLIGKEFMTRKPLWKECISRWFSYFTTIIFGVGLYYVLWQLSLKIYSLEPATGENSISQLENLTVEIFTEQVRKAYINFMNFFVGNNVVLGTMAKYSTILLLVLVLFAVFHYIKIKRVPVYNYVMIAVIVICYPLVALLMSILMGLDNIDYLTSFGVCLVHPIMLMVIFGIYKNKDRVSFWSRFFAVVLSLILLFTNISFSNGAYTTSKIIYDRTLSVMTRVLKDMDETEGYNAYNTEVVVLDAGAPDNINVITDKYDSMRGFRAMSISYTQTFKSFADSLGYDLNYRNDLSGLEMSVVENMPCYPYKGYCQMVDGVMVVKFGD